jgi:excinuclease ABC subunit C
VAAGYADADAPAGAPAGDADAPPAAPASGAVPGKSRHPDRVFLPHAKDAIPIRPNTAEMFVLQHLRDEAHRFAVTFHRQQRKRLTLRSALSTIPGIGLGRQRLLLRHFGSLKKIRESSLEDLVAVPGMTRKAAGAVYAHWKKQPLPADDGTGAVAGAGAGGAAARAPAPADADEDAIESAFADIEADAAGEEV